MFWTMINKASFAVFVLLATSSWTTTTCVESKVTSHRRLEDENSFPLLSMCLEASEAKLNKTNPNRQFYDVDLAYGMASQCPDDVTNGTDLSCIYDHAVQNKQQFDSYTYDCTKNGGTVYLWNGQYTCKKTGNSVTEGIKNEPYCLVLSESACSSNLNKFDGEFEAYTQGGVDEKESKGFTCQEPLSDFVKYSGCTVMDYGLGMLLAVSSFLVSSWYV